MAGAAPAGDDILATVGERKISRQELQQFMENASLPRPQTPQELSAILDDYLALNVIVEEAKKTKIDQLPSVQHQFNTVLYQGYVQKNVNPKLMSMPIPESEIKKFYAENPLFKTRQVLVKFSAQLDEKEYNRAKARAEKIVGDIRSGTITFEAAAEKYSDDYTKDVGGLMPEGGKFNLIPAYYTATLPLKPGEISGPVESIFGFHIIKLIERVPFSRMTEAYRNEITTHLRNNSGNTLLQDIVKGLKKKYAVKIFQDKLKL
jgi:parvulin-like peptidyl-prolyl isomerase